MEASHVLVDHDALGCLAVHDYCLCCNIAHVQTDLGPRHMRGSCPAKARLLVTVRFSPPCHPLGLCQASLEYAALGRMITQCLWPPLQHCICAGWFSPQSHAWPPPCSDAFVRDRPLGLKLATADIMHRVKSHLQCPVPMCHITLMSTPIQT